MGKVTDWLNSLWAPMIFMGPMPWLVKVEVQIPVGIKVAAVVMTIVGFAMIRPLKIFYAALIFGLFWVMGDFSWLVKLRPYILLAEMVLALYLDSWAAKERESRNV